MPIATVGYIPVQGIPERDALALEFAAAVPGLVIQAFKAVGLPEPTGVKVEIARHDEAAADRNIEPLELTIRMGPGSDGSVAARQVALRNALIELVRGYLMQEGGWRQAEIDKVEVDVHVIPMSGGVIHLATGRIKPTWGDRN